MEEREVESSPASRLKALLDNGKYRAAAKLGWHIASHSFGFDLDAHFWFQYALAVQLIGKDPEPLYEKARSSAGYSTEMEINMLRDGALMAVRLHQLNRAQALLEASRALLGPVPGNQHAAAYMTEARIAYAGGSYETASYLHGIAQRIWDELGDDADPQWVRNNRFHWFLAETRLNSSNAYRLGDIILRDEPIGRRKRVVRWAFQRGASAVVTYDNLERFGWTVKRLS